jgi:hypothetical protein
MPRKKSMSVSAASPIVSSAHLVSPDSAEMSEFEFGLIVAGNAFHRWIIHCMAAAGLKDLTPLDVLVLHEWEHAGGGKLRADVVAIDSGGASLVSTKHYSRKQWQALNPSSFRAFSHDGRYIALYTKTDDSRGMLIFDPTGQGPFHTTSSQNAATAITAAYSDPRTDTLYLAQGGNIIRYNSGSPLAYTWRSKPFRLATKINFGVAAIEAAAFPVTLKVYADGVLKQTKTVTSREPFKLKSGFKALQWQFEITGTNEVKRLRVATSGDELKQLQ